MDSEERLFMWVVIAALLMFFGTISGCDMREKATTRAMAEKGYCQVVLPGSSNFAWQKCQGEKGEKAEP